MMITSHLWTHTPIPTLPYITPILLPPSPPPPLPSPRLPTPVIHSLPIDHTLTPCMPGVMMFCCSVADDDDDENDNDGDDDMCLYP